jgi:hypothetical protein
VHGTCTCKSVRVHDESSLAQLYAITNLYARLEKAHDRDYESMMVYRIDLLGQTGVCERCCHGRPGERMGAISENATSSD